MDSTSSLKRLSIVIPVYYNELNLPSTIPALLALAEKLSGMELELIFVDDGSGDKSYEILVDFHARYPEQVQVIRLTRNFGSMAAIQAGLLMASGDCVGAIAADLQDPPELFLEMVDYWLKGTKAIFAVRKDRDEPWAQKAFSNTYYRLLRRFAVPNYPPGGFDFFLIDRQVVTNVNNIREKNTNLMTLIFWLGYRPVMIPYIRRERTAGKSRWTLRKKIKLFIDTFVSFSYFPIQALTVIGLIYAGFSFIYGLVILIAWLLADIPVRGFTPMMLVLTFTAGLQMTLLGVLGEYLWRTLDETRRRPPFVIDEVLQKGEAPSTGQTQAPMPEPALDQPVNEDMEE